MILINEYELQEMIKQMIEKQNDIGEEEFFQVISRPAEDPEIKFNVNIGNRSFEITTRRVK